jgi:hypothetical protein
MEVYYNPKTNKMLILVPLVDGLFAMISEKYGWVIEGKTVSRLTKLDPIIEQIVYIGEL